MAMIQPMSKNINNRNAPSSGVIVKPQLYPENINNTVVGLLMQRQMHLKQRMSI